MVCLAVPEARVERILENRPRLGKAPARLRQTDRKPRGGSPKMTLLIERRQKNEKFARKLGVGT